MSLRAALLNTWKRGMILWFLPIFNLLSMKLYVLSYLTVEISYVFVIGCCLRRPWGVRHVLIAASLVSSFLKVQRCESHLRERVDPYVSNCCNVSRNGPDWPIQWFPLRRAMCQSKDQAILDEAAQIALKGARDQDVMYFFRWANRSLNICLVLMQTI